MNRFILAGTHSGCGKTTLTCAILQALVNRGLSVSAFKSGPDYIDPMFHRSVLGIPSHNLDGFFCGKETLHALLERYAGDVNIIEGAMGYYDGLEDGTASAYRLAEDTGTPAVIIIDCKGMGQSVGAVMQGFLHFRQPSHVVGFIFNRLPESRIPAARQLCDAMNVTFFGAFPFRKELSLPSRHLGLVTADELHNIRQVMRQLGSLGEEHLDIDALAALMPCDEEIVCPTAFSCRNARHPRIAVARDSAFCFYYEETLDLLWEMGCELVFFSPLHDATLPDGVSGLLLGGGYPELHTRALSENSSLRAELKEKIAAGLPTVAECGGFLYLHEQLEGNDGQCYPMVGALKVKAFRTERLQRFGYVTLTASRDNLLCRVGESLPAHEFHYWESENCGGDFTACKASNGLTYPCIHATDSLYAGFPHLYLRAKPEAAERFIRKCEEYAFHATFN